MHILPSYASSPLSSPPPQFKVEFLPPPPGGGGYSAISLWDSKQSDRLRPIFALMLRRSSGHHPLLAGALREWSACCCNGDGIMLLDGARRAAHAACRLPALGRVAAHAAAPSAQLARCFGCAALQASWRRRTPRTGSSWPSRRTACSSWWGEWGRVAHGMVGVAQHCHGLLRAWWLLQQTCDARHRAWL